MYHRFRSIFAGIALFSIVFGAYPFAATQAAELSSTENMVISPKKPYLCADMVNCQLPIELNATEQYLRRNKVGLITPDPRPLTPVSEVLRLNVVPQALGYLTLYESQHSILYRREALDRLTYLQQVGSAAYGGGVRAGMVGFAFLRGYEIFGTTAYKTEALRIADECVLQNDHDAVMNGGLMCGFLLANAYRVTRNESYKTAARGIIERTAIYQRSSGGFPHQAEANFTEVTSYTAWMATELLLMRQSDPKNDLNDLLLSRVMPFLEQRVNADGSINYTDAYGSYYEDPGNSDTRYGTSEVLYIAFDLYSAGRRPAAQRALRFFFQTGLTGANRGAYPDKYRNIDPTNIWETSGPSVLRTSMNFWYMTLFSSMKTNSCTRGTTVSCAVTPSNCSSLYQSLAQCDTHISGTQTCLQGTYSACLDLRTTQFSTNQVCAVDSYCENDRQYGACFYTCPRMGNQVCVNGVCGGICYAVQRGEVQCESECYWDQLCPEGSIAPPTTSTTPGQCLAELP